MKISEMNEEQLKKFIQKYEIKVNTPEGTEKDQKVLKSLRVALTKIDEYDHAPSDVESFHSSEIDYTSLSDASTKSRAIALVIDAVVTGVANQILMVSLESVIKAAMPAEVKVAVLIANILLMISVPAAYSIFFLRRNGQTVGKMLMKIKVVYQENNEQLSVSTIILREMIGKMISSFVFMLGFIVHLFGRPAWHDSIAKTKVVSIK